MSLIRELPKYLAANLRGLGVLAVAASIAWSTAQVTHTWRANAAPRREVHTFEAAGTAKRHMDPTEITWNIGVEAHAATRASALEQLQSKSGALLDFLADHEIVTTEIAMEQAAAQESTETITKHHADGTDEYVDRPNGFTASQQIEIRSRDIARVLRTIRAIASEPQFATFADSMNHACTFGDVEALRAPLVAEARAHLRSEVELALAQLGHAKLGRLVHADIGMVGTDGGSRTCEDGTFATATVTGMYELD